MIDEPVTFEFKDLFVTRVRLKKVVPVFIKSVSFFLGREEFFEVDLALEFYGINSNLGTLTPTLQKSRMLQLQGVQGCSCSVLPQTLGNEGYAVCSAFPQGKKHANFIKILEFTWDRFQVFKLNFP